MVLVRLRNSQTDTAEENALNALRSLSIRHQFPICSPAARLQIKQALIMALEKENLLFHQQPVATPSGHYTETETEFYANVIGCIARFRDPAALHVLVGAIETGGCVA